MIETERLFLRPLEQEDFPSLLRMYQEPDSNKFIRPLRGKTEAEYLSFLNLKLSNNSKAKGYFLTVLNENQEVQGTANFNFFEPLQLEHIGVHLMRHAWGFGYGTEIIKALVKFAESKGRNEIHALVEKGNYPSVKMLEKSGLSFSKNLILSGDHLMLYKWVF